MYNVTKFPFWNWKTGLHVVLHIRAVRYTKPSVPQLQHLTSLV